jgi:hypothetical protein
MELFRLFGSVLVDSTEAEKSISRTDQKAQGLGTTLGNGIATIGKWGLALGGAAIAAGGAMIAIANKTADAGDRIDKLSQKIGMSRQGFQEWEFILSQSGTNIEVLQAGFKGFVTKINDATSGGEKSIAMFKELGVSLHDSQGKLKSQEQLFNESIVALQGMREGVEKSALANGLLGKSATELAPLINGATGSVDEMRKKANDLGLIIGDDVVDASVLWTDTIDQLKRMFGSFLIKLGAEVFPFVQKFANYLIENMPMIQEKTKQAFEIIEKAISVTVNTVKELTKFFQEHWDIIEPILAGIAGGAITFGIYTLAINAAAIATGIWTTVTTVATAAGSAFGAVLAFITSPIGIVIIAIGALVAAGVLLYKNWDTVKAKTTEFLNYLKELGTKVIQYGKDIVLGLWNGIQNMQQWVKDKILEFVGSIGKTIKDFFGIRSPSKLTAEYGKNIAEGMAKGITDNAQKAADAASKMSQMLIGELNKLGNATIAALKNRYQKEERMQSESLEHQINSVKTASDKNIKQYNKEYYAKLKLIKDEEDPKLKALQDEIDNINNLTKAEEKAKKEQEYNDKIASLKAELEASNSAEKKLSIQRELDELLAENARQALLEQRSARIEAIKNEMTDIQAASETKREQALKELENKKWNEKLMTDIALDSLKTQMEAMKTHYEGLLKEDNLQAEARRLTLDGNNKELIELLETYNPKWQDAGQSFGESLIEGLNSTKNKIKDVVNEIMSMVGSNEDRQNNVIAKAQEAWNKANEVGDEAAKAEAHRIAVEARKAGGTLGADNPINSYDVGTNYVPEDQLALIHKGEEIVPAKYNTPKYKPSKGIVININNPKLFNQNDADIMGGMIVNRLKALGVT